MYMLQRCVALKIVSCNNTLKVIGLNWQNNNLHAHHAFMYISLPSLHYYDVKMPNFTFCGGREHKTTTFFFFLWTSIQSFRIQLQQKLPRFDELNVITNKWDEVWSSTTSLFKWRFRSSRRRCCLSSLYVKLQKHIILSMLLIQWPESG